MELVGPLLTVTDWVLRLRATCLVLAAGDRARTQQSLVAQLDVSESQVRAAKPMVTVVLEATDLAQDEALAAVEEAMAVTNRRR